MWTKICLAIFAEVVYNNQKFINLNVNTMDIGCINDDISINGIFFSCFKLFSNNCNTRMYVLKKQAPKLYTQ